MHITIAQAVKGILRRDTFYGLFLLGLNKYFDNTVPTACVRKNGINIEIVINKDYWDSLDNELCINVLLHEILHVLYKHLWMQQDFPDKERFNIAADCHVNSYLWKTGEDWYLPKDFGFNTGMGTKWYYENLPDNIGYKSIDDHDWKDFNNLSDAEKNLISNQIDYIAREAAEQVVKVQGSLPGNLKEYLNGLLERKKVSFNWKSYFRRVIGNSIKSFLKRTKYKPSIRFKGQPGVILKFKPKILVAVDTSGSISKEELKEFFTEVNHIYKSGVQIEVVEFDTKIQNKFVYKGQKTDIKIVGRGGTDMIDVYNFYIARPDFSTLVVFTDGYLDTNFPRKNIIWVISSDGQVKDYPGITVYIPKKL